MKNLKTFESFFKKAVNYLKGPKRVDIDEDILYNMIKNEKNYDAKQILLIISKHINLYYITLYETEKFINDESIERIKSLGFLVKVYDDSNEYSDNFADKVKISWNYIGKNIIDIEDE